MTGFLVHMRRFTSSLKKVHLSEVLSTSRTTTKHTSLPKSLKNTWKQEAPCSAVHSQTFSSSLFCIPRIGFFLHYNWWDRADVPELPCSLQLGSSPVTPWWACGGLTQGPRSPRLLAPASSPDGLLWPAGQTTQAAASTATENVATLATHKIPTPGELLV